MTGAAAHELLESMGDGFFSLDRSWTFTYVNEPGAAIFRRPRADLIGRNIWERFPEAVGSPFQRAYERVMADRQPYRFTEYYPPYDGWYEINIHPSASGLAVFLRDVTVEKRAEVESAATIEFLRLLNGGTTVRGVLEAAAGFLRRDSGCDAVFACLQQGDELSCVEVGDAPDAPAASECGFDDARFGSVVALSLVVGDQPVGSVHLASRAPGGFPPSKVAFWERLAGSLAVVVEHRRSTEALAASERRLEMALAAAGQASWEADLSTGAVTTSRRLYELYGLPDSTTLRSREQWRALVLDEDRAEIQRANEEALRTGVLEVEYRLRRPSDGAVRWIHSAGQVHRDELTGRSRLVGISADVTDRRNAEAALRESAEVARRRAEELEALMDLVPAAIWVAHDPECRVITGNQAANRFYEATGGENVSAGPTTGQGKDSTRRFFREGRELSPEELPMQEAVARGVEVREAALEVLRPSGARMTMLGNASPLRDREGRIRGGIAAFVDISAWKRAEDRLRELNETLERRVEERTADSVALANQLRALAAELAQVEQRERRRLAGILHDHLQQLLVAARFQLDTIRREPLPPRAAACVQGVDSTLQDAITASRSLTVELSPPVLHEAGLCAALSWLAARMREKHGFHVEVRSESRAEPAAEDVRHFLFDSARELLFNAMKHSGVHEARVALEPADGDRTRLVVEDAGRGFDRSRRQREEVPEGFGLFSIEQRLAFLGGHMTVETAPGGGTRITLYAPLGTRPAAPPSVERVAPVEPATPPPRPGPSVTVLIVDDHRILRQGLTGLLSLEPDIDVVGQAGDGEEAVRLARELRPDVIVMDVNLPLLGGVEATRILARELPATRIIGLSMHVDSNVADAMRQAGAVAYLTKGGPSEDLVEAIRAGAPAVPGPSPAAASDPR